MNIVYIDAQSYAGGTANSVRVTAMLEALEGAGHHVTCYRERTGGSHGRGRTAVGKLARRAIPNAVFLGSGVPSWLDGLGRTPDLVICYGVDPRYLLRIQRWCRRRSVPLVIDVVDWYAAEDVTGLGSKLFCLINDQWVMRSLVRNCQGAIVVSRLLERHFTVMDIPTLRVPAVISGLPSAAPPSPESFTLSYAGAPGLREARVLANLRRLAVEGELARLGIKLRIIGMDRPADSSPDDEPQVTYCGRVARGEALRLVGESTMTVLQRTPERRFAQAGFPSKVAESLLLGVPVISNLSSDLAEILEDCRNAIVLSDDSYESLLNGLDRATRWVSEIDRAEVHREAVSLFSPDAMRDQLSTFLTAIVETGSDD